MEEFQQIREHYTSKGKEPRVVVKTKFKFKWGLPFPFIVLTDETLDIIAIKQHKPKLYKSIPRKDLLYVRQADHQLVIALSEEELLVPLDDQADMKDVQSLLDVLK